MSCTYSATCIATVKFSRRLPGLRSSYGTSSGRKECRIAHSASPSAKLLLKSLTSTFCVKQMHYFKIHIEYQNILWTTIIIILCVLIHLQCQIPNISLCSLGVPGYNYEATLHFQNAIIPVYIYIYTLTIVHSDTTYFPVIYNKLLLTQSETLLYY